MRGKTVLALTTEVKVAAIWSIHVQFQPQVCVSLAQSTPLLSDTQPALPSVDKEGESVDGPINSLKTDSTEHFIGKFFYPLVNPFKAAFLALLVMQIMLMEKLICRLVGGG